MRARQAGLILMCCVSLLVSTLTAAGDEAASTNPADPDTRSGTPSGAAHNGNLDSVVSCGGKHRAKAMQSRVSALLAAYEENSGDAEASKFVTVALQAQAHRDVDWDPLWGEWIYDLRREGKVSDGQWKQYITRAVFYDCILRWRVRADIPIAVYFYESCSVRMGDSVTPLNIDYTWRVGSATLVYSETQMVPLEVRYYLDQPDHVQTAESTYGDRFWPRGPFTYHLRFYLRPKDHSQGDLWQTGKARLKVRIDITYLDRSGETQKTYSRQFPYEREIQIVDNRTSTVTLSAEPDLRERVAQSIRATCLQEHEGAVSLPFDISSRPLGLACEVYVRQDATSWKLGTVTSPERTGFRYRYISAKLPDVDVNRPADVVFRPAARLAETTPHLYEIWGEEIVKSNVRIASN